MWTLYVLSCLPGIEYVGISSRIDKRLYDHYHRKGSAITRKFRPVGHALISIFSSEAEAKKAEWGLVQKMRSEGFVAYGAGSTHTPKLVEEDEHGDYREVASDFWQGIEQIEAAAT